MAKSQKERDAEQLKYEQLVEEHKETIKALEYCMEMVKGLMSSPGSLVEMKAAREHLGKLLNKIKRHHYKSEVEPLIKILAQMAQNFSDARAVKKVYGLLEELRDKV